MLLVKQMLVATPGGFEPPTFSLEGRQEYSKNQRGLIRFPVNKCHLNRNC
jgi:hypothetical protein